MIVYQIQAIVTCMGMNEGGGRVYEHGNIKREEVIIAVGNLERGKAPHKAEIRAVINWMHIICNLA